MSEWCAVVSEAWEGESSVTYQYCGGIDGSLHCGRVL